MSITGDYGYGAYTTTSSAVSSGVVGALLVIWVIMLLISLALSVLMLVSLWKIFTKNGKPGWYSLIPFLNLWTLFEIVGIAGWWCLVPIANSIFMLIASYKIAIKYGRSQGFAVVNLLFPYIGYPILAFSKKKEVEEVKIEKVEDKEETNKKTKSTTKKSPSKKDTKFCSECGTEMEKDAKFCPKCGAKTK